MRKARLGAFMDTTIESVQDFANGSHVQAVIAACVILIVTAIVSHVITKLIRRVMQSDGAPLPSSSIIVNIARIVVWMLGISITLSSCFGVDVNAMLAALGIGGVALSLGLQDTLKNFIGGLQVTLMRIAQPGDHIVVGGVEGIVKDVNWRHTVVKDFENNLHIVPNSVISSTTVQRTTPSFIVVTPVVLNTDGRNVDEVLRLVERVAKEALADYPLVKDPWMLVTQIGEYGVWAKMRFVLENVDHAREARDAALRAIAPYTRNNASELLEGDTGELS